MFAALPERLGELLASTSGTGELALASAAAVSGQPDAGLLLDTLVDEGLLCTAEDEDAVRRYRYHPLLLSLLRRGTRAPGRVARAKPIWRGSRCCSAGSGSCWPGTATRALRGSPLNTLNTLKTQVRATYRKLGADSRADAVQRAQELGLIGRR